MELDRPLALARTSNAARYRLRRERLKARTPGQIRKDQIRLHPDGLKTCKDCHETRPLSEFRAITSRPDGLAPRCNPCKAQEPGRTK